MSKPVAILVTLIGSVLGAFAGAMIFFWIVAIILYWLNPQDPGATEPALLAFIPGGFVGFGVTGVLVERYLNKRLEAPQPRGFSVVQNPEIPTSNFELADKNPAPTVAQYPGRGGRRTGKMPVVRWRISR